MKTLTPGMATKVATNLGTEPIILVQIDWDSGTAYYCDKEVTVGSDDYTGAILQLSDVLTTGEQDTLGTVGNVSLTLDDSDGAIKSILDGDVMEGRVARVYQYFVGLADSDKLLLLQGTVAGPVKWDEGTRKIEFTIETLIDDQKIGFAPTKSDLADLHDDAVGVPWPMCFGSPLRVPAVQIYKGIYGRTRDLENLANSSTIYVDGGEDFPQSTPITIGIRAIISQYVNWGIRAEATIYCEGSFSGNVFTTTAVNVAEFENVTFAARIASDEDYNNPSVAWISDSSQNLINKLCYIDAGTHGYMINFCYKQDGAKCYFTKPWKANGIDTEYEMPSAIPSITQIDEVANDPRTAWGDTYKPEGVSNGVPFTMGLIIVDGWQFQPGSLVFYVGAQSPTYVANLFESSSVSEVMAYRKVDGDTEKQLVPVPSSYYTITLDESIAGQTATIIELDMQLSLKEDEGWEDDLFVSLTSTKGNNSATAIKTILDTYSDLSTDSTTFAAVASDLTNYIANFAILDQPDALTVCKDIAWQSRCALLVKNDTVYITYLSKEIAGTDTFTAASLLLKSFSASFTETDDIITKLNGLWREEMSDEYVKYEYENNVSDYGLIEEDRTFWIYNIEQLVKYSNGFWGYRYSNSWRKAFFKSAFSHLKSETFDTVIMNLTQLSGNTLRGFVEDAGVNTLDYSLQFEVLLASLAGASDSAGPIEEDNFWKGDPNNEVDPSNPLPTDPISSRSQVDYIVEVPTEARAGNSQNTNNTRKLILTAPVSVNRSTNFTVEVEVTNEFGQRLNVSGEVTLTLDSTDTSDALSVLTLTMANGYATSAVQQITGGTGTDQGVIIPAMTGVTAVESANVAIGASGQPRFDTYPDLVVRDQLFDVSIVDGPISSSVSITLTSYDSTGDSLVDSGGSAVTTVTTDGSGNWSGQWKLTGGTDTSTTARISCTYGGWTFVGDLISVIEVDSGGGQAYVLEDVNQVAHGFVENKAVGRLRSTGVWEYAGIDRAPLYDMKGIVVEVTDANNFIAQVAGFYEKDLSGTYSDNTVLYLLYASGHVSVGTLDAGTDEFDTSIPWAIATPDGYYSIADSAIKDRASVKIVLGSDTNHAAGTPVYPLNTSNEVKATAAAHGTTPAPIGVVESTYASAVGDNLSYNHVVVLSGIIRLGKTDGTWYLSETAGTTTQTRPEWGKPLVILEAESSTFYPRSVVNIHEDANNAPAIQTTNYVEDSLTGSGTTTESFGLKTSDSDKVSCRVVGRMSQEDASNGWYDRWNWEWVRTPDGNATFSWDFMGFDLVSHTGNGSDSPADVLNAPVFKVGGGSGNGPFTLQYRGSTVLQITFSIDTGDDELDVSIYRSSAIILDYVIQAHGPVFENVI